MLLFLAYRSRPMRALPLIETIPQIRSLFFFFFFPCCTAIVATSRAYPDVLETVFAGSSIACTTLQSFQIDPIYRRSRIEKCVSWHEFPTTYFYLPSVHILT